MSSEVDLCGTRASKILAIVSWDRWIVAQEFFSKRSNVGKPVPVCEGRQASSSHYIVQFFLRSFLDRLALLHSEKEHMQYKRGLSRRNQHGRTRLRLEIRVLYQRQMGRVYVEKVRLSSKQDRRTRKEHRS